MITSLPESAHLLCLPSLCYVISSVSAQMINSGGELQVSQDRVSVSLGSVGLKLGLSVAFPKEKEAEISRSASVYHPERIPARSETPGLAVSCPRKPEWYPQFWRISLTSARSALNCQGRSVHH